MWRNYHSINVLGVNTPGFPAKTKSRVFAPTVIAHGGTNPRQTGAIMALAPPSETALSNTGKCLFGAVLIDPSCAAEVRRMIPANIFMRPHDRTMYQAILDIDWPDIVQVTHHFRKAISITAFPKDYISGCIKVCPICFEYKAYAEACIYYADLLKSDGFTNETIKGGASI